MADISGSVEILHSLSSLHCSIPSIQYFIPIANFVNSCANHSGIGSGASSRDIFPAYKVCHLLPYASYPFYSIILANFVNSCSNQVGIGPKALSNQVHLHLMCIFKMQHLFCF